MYLEKMPARAKPEDPVWTVSVMTYELGSLMRALIRASVKQAQGETKSANAYRAEAMGELSDVVSQCRLLMEQMNWKPVDVQNFGFERFCQRMQELAAGKL
jgi:hypothetical protein